MFCYFIYFYIINQRAINMVKENFMELLESSIKNNWEYEAFSDYQGNHFTYNDVAWHIKSLHASFAKLGILQDDKIAIIGRNSSHWAISFLSVITYGAIVVPILPDFHPEDMHHILNHSDSKLLLVADNIYDNLDREKFPGVKEVISLGRFNSLDNTDVLFLNINDELKHKQTREAFSIEKHANDKLVEISYTSGTTGFSKGVMLPNNSLVANVMFAQRNMPLQPGDEIVSFLPLAHSYGCAFEFLFPFTLGCHVHFLTKIPSPQKIVQAFQEVRPRLILTVPLVMEKIYKKRILPSISKGPAKTLLKLPIINKTIKKKVRQKLSESFGHNFHEVVIGGAALGKDVELFLKDIGFPFTVGYGMTECGPLISYSSWKETKLHSAGKLVDNLELKIDSSDPYHEAGEILVRGENVMLGYYKNEEATKQSIDDEGWLHTGDLGLTDEDNTIFIKGRSKSMILGPSGQNIYPEAIESKLNNLPYVQESLIIEKDSKLVALVYPDYEAADAHKIQEQELQDIITKNKDEVNKQLPAYMNISRVKLYPQEFEKTPKKSIKRFLYQDIGD